MSVITIQTTASTIQNKAALDYLEEYGIVFGQATRTAFSLRNKIGRTQTKESELEKTICKELEKRFGLSNTEAKNVYNKAEAAYSSQSELAEFYIEDNYERIKGLRRAIKTLESKLDKAESSGQKGSARRIKRQINFKQQKINKIDAKIARLKKSRDTGHFTVTFGSSKLFEKQYRLEENGYQNKEEWLKDWRAARSNRSFFIGSKNYQGGNQLVRYDAKKYTLTITVTPKLRAKYGDTVTLHNINFAYGQEWLLAAIEQVLRTSTRKGNDGEKKETSRNGSKQPVTYEIINRDGEFYVNCTVETVDPVIQTSLGNGALGIDFNPTSIDWTLIDRHGNLKRHGTIKINVHAEAFSTNRRHNWESSISNSQDCEGVQRSRSH